MSDCRYFYILQAPNNVVIVPEERNVTIVEGNPCRIVDVKSEIINVIEVSNSKTFGLPGPSGSKGDKGDTGSIGPSGSKGDKGDIGPSGSKGDQGDIGPSGSKGDKGDIGPSGSKGDTGSIGPSGSKGDKGDQGDIGPSGSKGDPGPVNLSLGGKFENDSGMAAKFGDDGQLRSSAIDLDSAFYAFTKGLATGIFAFSRKGIGIEVQSTDTSSLVVYNNSLLSPTLFVSNSGAGPLAQFFGPVESMSIDTNGGISWSSLSGSSTTINNVVPPQTGNSGKALMSDGAQVYWGSGSKGDKGDTGSIGPSGSKGDTGSIGPSGSKGDTGSIGPSGSKGNPGQGIYNTSHSVSYTFEAPSNKTYRLHKIIEPISIIKAFYVTATGSCNTFVQINNSSVGGLSGGTASIAEGNSLAISGNTASLGDYLNLTVASSSSDISMLTYTLVYYNI